MDGSGNAFCTGPSLRLSLHTGKCRTEAIIEIINHSNQNLSFPPQVLHCLYTLLYGLNNQDIFSVFEVLGDIGNNTSLIIHLKYHQVNGKLMVLALYICFENSTYFL